MVCPGGQGDVSVYGNLLFMSVEETRAKKDCTLTPAADARPGSAACASSTSATWTKPVQVGRRTDLPRLAHATLVTDKDDQSNVYIYVQGTAGVRPATELPGCDGNTTAPEPAQPNPSRWRIEVIKVPLAAPEDAAVVNEPRLFSDPATGAVNGLQNAPRRRCTRPASRGARRRPPTPATTSPCTRSSRSRPVPVRATAC